MLAETIRSSFGNQGQICLCGSRVLIERSVYEKFKNEFAGRVKYLTVGDPLLENSKQGAIVSELHYKKILNCIEIAKAEGGKILIGGNAIKLEGRCAKWIFY